MVGGAHGTHGREASSFLRSMDAVEGCCQPPTTTPLITEFLIFPTKQQECHLSERGVSGVRARGGLQS